MAMTPDELIDTSMMLIVHSGDARAAAFHALQEAKAGNFEEAKKLMAESKAKALEAQLKAAGIRVKVDDTDNSPGWKFAQYEMKGVPVRLEIGPKDIEQDQCVLVTRHNREKTFCPLSQLVETVQERLQAVHDGMYEKALENRKNRTYVCKSMDEIQQVLAEKGDGFIEAMWCGDEACEDKVKEVTGVGSRCIPLEQKHHADT